MGEDYMYRVVVDLALEMGEVDIIFRNSIAKVCTLMSYFYNMSFTTLRPNSLSFLGNSLP